jgi:hypothetical protein
MEFLKKYKYETGVVLLTLFLMYFIFGSYLWKPDSMMMAFGGDALVLYYNTLYHACYGNGLMLENMNYPQGELIFMTDAQGVLSIFLMGLNKLGINTCDCAVGFVHFFNHYSLIPAALLMYYVLVRLEIRKEFAMIFGVLIIFLSPQMFRFSAHYGLAYLFVIPMVILYIIQKRSDNRIGYWDFIVFMVLMLLTYNNAYVGFIGASTGMMAGGVYILLNGWQNRKIHVGSLVLFFVCFTALFLPYLTLHFLDTTEDRLLVQWGFTTYATNWRGSLYPPNTLMHIILTSLGAKINPPEFESIQYLGFIPVLLLVSYLSLVPFKSGFIKVRSDVKLIVAASLILYVYSSNINILGSSFVHYIEEHLGFLLMFKASGRIGWPLYFAVSIFAVYLLNHYLNFLFKEKSQFLVLIPVVFIWIMEINLFVKPAYMDVFHANFLSKEKQEEFKVKLESKGFKRDEFQALLCIPKTEFWSDKFLSYNHWPTHFYATLVSLTFELPMANALLSRPGTLNNALNTQLLSHPLIVREKPAYFKDKRDILVVSGKQHGALSVGEEYILKSSSVIYEDENIQLLRFKFDQFFNNPSIQEAQKMQSNLIKKEPLHHEGFDNESASFVFYGKGAKLMQKGDHEVLNKAFSLYQDTVLTFSVWTKIDNRKYGLGDWIIRSIDEKGSLYEEVIVNPRNSYDVQHGFVRASCDIKVKKEGRVNIHFLTNQTFIIDELVLDYKGNNSFSAVNEKGYFMFNNFKILQK